jgi:predicted alpha/beta-fold hydrolase
MIRPFIPRRGLANGHLMTVVAWARRRAYPGLPDSTPELFQLSDGASVLAECRWQVDALTKPTLLALHGLEGSSDVHYMRGLAHKAWRRGWNAVLLNQRNCGGTEGLSERLYHSGLTGDPHAVLRALAAKGFTRFGVAGYSLGGNLTLKLAGELGSAPDVPIRAVAAVCPTIDLDLCVRAIERRSNFGYQWNFVRNLKARLKRMAVQWPGRFDVGPLDDVSTIRAFDEVYTSRHHGFDGATDYYHRASALRVVDQIRIPALIIAADDDPVVPASQFRTAAVTSNSSITTSIWPHGGHCGFIARPGPDDDGYWAETTVIEFLAEHLER